MIPPNAHDGRCAAGRRFKSTSANACRKHQQAKSNRILLSAATLRCDTRCRGRPRQVVRKIISALAPRAEQREQVEYVNAAVAREIGRAIARVITFAPRAEQREEVEHVDGAIAVEISGAGR
jgi:hypothetical protein